MTNSDSSGKGFDQTREYPHYFRVFVCRTLRIKLAINKSAVCLAPVAVAEQQKIFSKYNLDVEFVNFGNSTDVLLEA